MSDLEIKKAITYSNSETLDFVKTYMVDGSTYQFRLMLKEALNAGCNTDYELIGRLFKRAYDNTINDYVTMSRPDEIPQMAGTRDALEDLKL